MLQLASLNSLQTNEETETENHSKEIEVMKKNQAETTELKHTKQIKNPLEAQS